MCACVEPRRSWQRCVFSRCGTRHAWALGQVLPPVEFKLVNDFFALEGIWGRFPNSRGVVKTNLGKKLVAVVGLSIQIPNKMCLEHANFICIRLENANEISKKFCSLLRRRNSGPAVPTWGWYLFILSSFKFVPYLLLTSTRNTNSLVFQTKFVCTGNCEKYRFDGESSQNVRDDVFCLPACPPKVARPIRVTVRVTPCRGMPTPRRCPPTRDLPAIRPRRIAVSGRATSRCLMMIIDPFRKAAAPPYSLYWHL